MALFWEQLKGLEFRGVRDFSLDFRLWGFRVLVIKEFLGSVLGLGFRVWGLRV